MFHKVRPASLMAMAGRNDDLRFGAHRFNSQNPQTPQASWSLHCGDAGTPLALIVPDDDWPGMWRIVWPSSQRSDLANLSRIKDAAELAAIYGPPPLHAHLLHWEIDRAHAARNGHRCVETAEMNRNNVEGVANG